MLTTKEPGSQCVDLADDAGANDQQTFRGSDRHRNAKSVERDTNRFG